MRYTSRFLFFISLAVLFILAGCALLATPAHADGKSATYERRDYQAQIQSNGDVQVTEHWLIHFTGGPFHHAFLQIHMAETVGVDFGAITGAGVTNQIVTQTTDSAGEPERQAAWDFPTTQNATRTFDIPYIIHGALQLNTTQAWFDWHYFDGPSGSPLPITSSTITIMLPMPAATTDLHLQAVPPDVAVATTVVNGTTASAQAGGTVANHPLEMQIVFLRTELDTTVQRPVWQRNDAPADLAQTNAGAPTGNGGGATYYGTGNPSPGSLMSALMCLVLPLVVVFSLVIGATQHNGSGTNRWIGGGRFNGPYNGGPGGGGGSSGGGIGGGGGMSGGSSSGGGGAGGGGGGGSGFN